MIKKNKSLLSKLLLSVMAFTLIIGNFTTLRAQSNDEELVEETKNTLQITGPESVNVEEQFEVEIINDGSEYITAAIPKGLEYQNTDVADAHYNEETNELTLNEFEKATISLVALEEGEYNFLLRSTKVEDSSAFYTVNAINVETESEVVAADIEGTSSLATFDGVSLDGYNEFTTTLDDFTINVNKVLNVVAEYPASADNKKLTIAVTKEMNIVQAPGMVVDNKNKTLVFDKNSLPSQLAGAISNATFKKNSPVHPGLDNVSGTLEYDLSPETTKIGLDFLIANEYGFIATNSSVSFDNPLTVSLEYDGMIHNTERIEKITFDDIKVNPYLYNNAVNNEAHYYPEDTENLMTPEYQLGTTGAGTSYRYKSMIFKKAVFYYEVESALEPSGIIYGGRKNPENTSYEIVEGPDHNKTYIKYTFENFITNGSRAQLIFDVKSGEQKSGEVYTVRPMKGTQMDVVTYYGEEYSARNVGGTMRIFIDEYDNSAEVADIKDEISLDEKNHGQVVPLGRFDIMNNNADIITDQMFRIDFDTNSIGVKEVYLNSGTKKAYDIYGVTNKGNKFTYPDINSGVGVNRKIKLENSSINPSSDEYIKQINWTEESIAGDFRSAKNAGISSQYYGTGYFNYSGIILDEAVDSTVVNTIKTVSKEENNFESDKVKTAKNSLVLRDIESRLIHRVYSSNIDLKGGQKTNLRLRWEMSSRSTTAMRRYDKGFIFYMRQPKGLLLDVDTFRLRRSNGDVYSLDKGNIFVSEIIDNFGYPTLKIELPDFEFNMGDGTDRSMIDITVGSEKTSQAFSYNAKELFFLETMNANTVPDYLVAVENDTYGLSNIHSRITGAQNNTNIKNEAEINFHVNTAANLNGGRWITYDGTDKTIISLNPEGVAKYKLNVLNTSGQPVNGYGAIIPIPKAGENTGNEAIQEDDFKWDINLEEEIDTSNTNYNYSVKYSETYETNFDESKTNSWKNWSEISNKENIRAIKISTDDIVNDIDNETTTDPGQDEIVFTIGFASDKAEEQAGEINIYSALINRSLGTVQTIVPSEPVAIQLKTGVVEGTVFKDENRNGTQDKADKGMNRIAVSVYETGHAGDYEHQIGTTINTDNDGKFSFMGLDKSPNVDIVVNNPVNDDTLRFSTPHDGKDDTRAIIKNVEPSSLIGRDLKIGLMSPLKVTMHPNGGQVGKEVINKYPGESITAKDVVDARKPGYKFEAWNTERADQLPENDVKWPLTIDREITLYARYTANKYNVVFNANGGQGTMDKQEFTYDIAQNLTTNTFTKAGHTFKGWATSPKGEVVHADKASVKNLKESGDITLYAVWEANKYTVTFNANNGKGTMADQTFVYGKEQELTANSFTNPGYTFKGWSMKQDGAVDFADKAKVKDLRESGNVTLYAVWEANKYTVKFDSNGGTGGTMADQTMEFDVKTALRKNTFTKDGYTFKGWSKNTDGSKEFDDEELVESIIPEGSITLYAVWEANTYEVLFDANGGKGTMPAQSFTYDVAQKLTANTFTRNGYTFLGWAKSSNGKVEFANEAEVSNLAKDGEFILYAVWEANIYNVNFDANGGEGTMTPQSIAFDKHVDLKANAFTRDGYTFEGWSKSADGDVAYQDEENVKNITTEGSVTLYAVWTKTYLIEAHDFKIGTEQLKEAGNKAAISEMFEEYAGAKTWLKDFEDEALDIFVKHDVTINTIPGTYNVEFRSVEDSSVRTTVVVDVVEGIVIVDPKKEFEITAKSFELTVKEAKELVTDNSILFERSGVKAINLSNNEEVKVDVDFSAIKAEHGVYDVVFTINGQDTKVTVKATVDKGAAPVIKVEPKVEVIELGKEIDFTNGVTITDDRDDSGELITNMVVKGKENVNVNKVDTYIVEYSVIDSDDNVSNTVKRTYIINDGSIGELEDFYILADNFVIKAEDVDTVNPEAQIVSKAIAEVINKNTGEVEEAIVKDAGGYTNKEGIYDIVLASKDHDTVTYEIKATVKEEGQVIEGDKYYISAQDFTIGLIDAENISDETIIELSKAEAIHKTLDNGTVEVEHSDIRAEAGTYDVILNVKEEKDTKVTIKVTVLPYDEGNSHKEFMIGANNFKVGKEQLSKAGSKADIDKLFIELAKAKGWNVADKNTSLELVVDHTIDANTAVGAHDVTFSIADEPKATITVNAEILEGSITVDPDKKYELTAHKVELFVGEAKPVVDNNDLLIGLTDAKAIELASGDEKNVVLVETNIEAKDGEYTAEFQIEGTTVNLVVDIIVKKGGIPVIELDEHVTIVELGTAIDFTKGVTINDDRDSHDDLIGNLVVAGKEDVNVDKVGAYTVEYSVMDTDDNTSKKVKRTYIINDGSLPEVVEDHYVLAENFVIESKHVDEANKDAQILKESSAQIVEKTTGKVSEAIVVSDGGYSATAGEYTITIGSGAHSDIKRDIVATVKDKGGVVEGDKYFISAEDFTIGLNTAEQITHEEIIKLSNAVATHKTLENGTIKVAENNIQAVAGTYTVTLQVIEEADVEITINVTVLPYDEGVQVDEFILGANNFKVGTEQLDAAGDKAGIDALFIKLADAKGWKVGAEGTALDLVLDYSFDKNSVAGSYDVKFSLKDHPEVSITVTVELKEGIIIVDPMDKVELTAHSIELFVSEAKEVLLDKDQLINLADAIAFDADGNALEVEILAENLEAIHGDYKVTFRVKGTNVTLEINVKVDKGESPVIVLDERVKVIDLGGTIDFYDGVSYVEDRDSDDYLNAHLVIDGQEDVNTDKVGTYVVNYSVVDSDDNESNTISRTYIVNDGSLPEVVEDHYVLAESFVIKSEDVDEANAKDQILTKSKAQVVNKTTGEITDAIVKDEGGYQASQGEYTIIIGSEAHEDIEREIVATVTYRDEVIEGDKYYISAHDFTLGYNDVMDLTDEKIIELSNAEATHKTLENGTIEVVSEDIQTLEGTYEVVLGIVEEPETQITVIATVLPEDNVVENDEYTIVANDVVYGHKEVLSVTKDQLLADANARAIHKVTGEEIALNTDYEIDTEIGIYEVTYFLEGQDMEVKASMTVVREALYYIDAQEGTMNLSEYNAAEKAGTLDDKVLEITNAKAHMTTEDNEVIKLATFVQDIAVRKDAKGNAVSLQVKLGAKEYVNPFLRLLSGERDITAVSKTIEVTIVNDIVESETPGTQTPGTETPETGITQTYVAYIIIAVMSLLVILLNKTNRYRKEKI